MNERNILSAFDGLDDSILEECAPKECTLKKGTEKERRQKESSARRLFTKRGISIAASLLLVFTLGLLLLLDPLLGGSPDSPDNDGAQQPDKVSGAWLGDFFYTEMTGTVYHEIYPALLDIAEKTAVGYSYEIDESCIGKYLGEFPETEHHPSGEAYRWTAYPDYDSIIIVKREGSYSFYVSDGNELKGGRGIRADEILEKHGLPDSAVRINLGASPTDGDVDPSAAEVVAEILEGKSVGGFEEMRDRKWEEWQALHGDVGVRYEGGNFIFDNPDIRAEFALFYGSGIHTFYIETERGFELLFTYEPSYNLIRVAGNHYPLTDAEVEKLNTALGI